MTSPKWKSSPALLLTVLLSVVFMDCGGGTTTQGPDPDADAPDVLGDAETLDAPPSDDVVAVDVKTPSACLTGQVCAADTDCNQGERCNLTLGPPQCQTLYCAKEAEACDPTQGDALCAPGLVCTGSPQPACCAPDCDGKACGSDGCGNSCGSCECGEACTAGACVFTACDGKACGDDGCGGACGGCTNGETCVAGQCTCAGTTDGDCDGIDDDCDGQPDQGFMPTATSCGNGVCIRTGSTTCVGGVLGDTCVPATPPTESDATCNNVDDDCDGHVDENYVPVASCFKPGACALANKASSCLGGVETACVAGTPAAIDATCDGSDDDCDGLFDEDFAPDDSCFNPGACASANKASSCAGGVLSPCTTGLAAANDATCDGSDNDCDGQTDENYVPVNSCFKPGACAAANAASSCTDGVETACATGTPAPHDATCDGIDNDCDGQTDESAACDDGDLCNGISTCVAGSCVQTTEPVVCADQDVCHEAGTCDPATGACSTPCVFPPAGSCAGTTAVTYRAGICVVIEGAATCSYPPEQFDCADDGMVCVDAACVQGKNPTIEGQVIVTEFMARSQSGSGDLGEWFELTNTTDLSFDLGTCRLTDYGTDGFDVEGPLIIGPYSILLLAPTASETEFGTTPDYVYEHFTLTNNSIDEMVLRCGDVMIDSVAYTSAWVATGTAMQLSTTAFDAVLNDDVANWCLATSAYNATPKFGTPGAGNFDCAIR